jgi:hypothetical protein
MTLVAAGAVVTRRCRFCASRTIIAKRSLASLASSTPMAFACRRSSDLVLGESRLIACALVMPLYKTTGPFRSCDFKPRFCGTAAKAATFSAAVAFCSCFLDEKWHNCTAEHFQKLAGPFCELLVGQFTSGMFGLESFVNGGQWVNRVAKVHAAHQRVNSGGCESPVQFCCYVAGFHLLPRFHCAVTFV